MPADCAHFAKTLFKEGAQQSAVIQNLLAEDMKRRSDPEAAVAESSSSSSSEAAPAPKRPLHSKARELQYLQGPARCAVSDEHVSFSVGGLNSYLG